MSVDALPLLCAAAINLSVCLSMDGWLAGWLHATCSCMPHIHSHTYTYSKGCLLLGCDLLCCYSHLSPSPSLFPSLILPLSPLPPLAPSLSLSLSLCV